MKMKKMIRTLALLLLIGTVTFMQQGCSDSDTEVSSNSGLSITFTNCKLEQNVPSSKNKDIEMLKLSYDYNIKGGKGHEIQIVMSVESPKGTQHYKKDGNPLEYKDDPFVVTSEDFSAKNKGIGLYNHTLNPKPGKNTYYAYVRAFDKTTGEIVGKSKYFKFKLKGESKSDSNEPTIAFYNCRIEENAKGKNGGTFLRYHYSYVINGAKGHELRKVLSIETPKGTLHRKKDGTPMEFDDNQPRLIEEDKSDIKDRYYGINYNSLNLLSGKHTYYARMKIYDKGTGALIGASPYLTYTMTGKSNTDSNKKNTNNKNTNNQNTNKNTSNKPQASFSNCRLEPNVIDNGIRALKCYCTLITTGLKGHGLKLVISIETPDNLLIYESKTSLTATYDSTKWTDLWIAISNDKFLQPGENLYYVRYMLYDETLKTTVGSSDYMTFRMTGAYG